MTPFRPILITDSLAYHELVKRNADRLRDYFPKSKLAAESKLKSLELIESYIEKSKNNEMHVFVIPGNNESIIGVLFIKDIIRHHSKAELAYFIDEAFEGKGIMSKALSSLLQFCFYELNLNKVYCRIDPSNTGSIAVALKNGFIEEGLLRKEFRTSNANFIDLLYFGLLNSEHHIRI